MLLAFGTFSAPPKICSVSNAVTPQLRNTERAWKFSRSPYGGVRFNWSLGLKPCLVIRRKMPFAKASIFFGLGRCDRHIRFQGFEIFYHLWLISLFGKVLQKDFKDFISPFLSLLC